MFKISKTINRAQVVKFFRNFFNLFKITTTKKKFTSLVLQIDNLQNSKATKSVIELSSKISILYLTNNKTIPKLILLNIKTS